MVAAAALACSVLASLALALHAATARPQYMVELSGLDHSHAAIPQRVPRVSCAHCSAPAFCLLCFAPPAVDLFEALDRCVCVRVTRRACCFCLRMSYFCCFVLPLRFFLGVGAPSLSLAGFMIKAKAVRRGSLTLFVVTSAACVYETGLLLVCACRTSAASVEPLPRGSRTVAFPRPLHEFYAA